MITPELVGYMRGEFAKGRTREEIRQSLISEGGWSEADLSEAFRIIIPMQDLAENPAIVQPKSEAAVVPSFKFLPILKIISIVAVIGALGFGLWFYRTSYVPALKNFWSAGISGVKGLTGSLFRPKAANPDENAAVAPPETVAVRDCGAGTMPDLKNPQSYLNSATLDCMGASALNCQAAKATLSGDLFPNNFEIMKRANGGCDFKLSYPESSTLVDAAGHKLALQSITCPVSIVKMLDESKNPAVFSSPSTDNGSKYGSQIYFYGTLGIFIETNLDKARIANMGCSGNYIDSIISSYNKSQSAS